MIVKFGACTTGKRRPIVDVSDSQSYFVYLIHCIDNPCPEVTGEPDPPSNQYRYL